MKEEYHVVFGTGPLGKSVARELVRLGKRVRMVNRSGKLTGFPAEVEVVAGDAYDLKRNIELTQAASVVYQCAQPLYYEWAEKFPAFQAAILEAVASNGAKLVVGDNLYMYGDTHGQPIREDLPYQAHTKKGKIRAEMAEAVMAAHARGKISAAIGRASNFFGPEDHVVTDMVIRPALLGKTINLLGRMDQPHTFSYVADFGRFLATLGTHDQAWGQTWFTPSPAAVTQAEFVKLLEAEIGKPVKVMVAGPLMIKFLGLFNPMIRETIEMMYEWTQPFVVDTSKAEKAFDFKATPLAQAIRETVTWLRKDIAGQGG
ncbi:MAG: NAD-dependent epimerase/dehydratase family protein [Chloroflexi bacterium]|nr:NAD-dependent epimerase/dehydratase family protein [Chloroflexota bacterium]